MLGVLHYFLILCFGIHQIASFEGLEGGFCKIDMSIPKFPLVVKPNSAIVYFPMKHSDILDFRSNETVEFHCPGSTVVLRGYNTGNNWITATCLNNKPGKMDFAVSEITCYGPKIVTRRETNKSCGYSAKLINFLHFLKPGISRYIFQICFKRKRGLALFTHHTIHPVFYRKLEDEPDPLDSLIDSDLYSDNSDPISVQIYNKTYQKRRINFITHLANESQEYIKDDIYLVPSYLIPDADLYYREWQVATRRFLNAVPQWNTVQNWKKLEQHIRRSCMKIHAPLKIWTGIFGTLKLRGQSSTNNNVYQIYLYDKNTTMMYPIPGMMWKLVYSWITLKAIVFISFQNPYFIGTVRNLCEDVASEAGWMVGWDRKNLTKGYIYGCTYHDFRELCPYSPDIQVTGLLKLYER